MKYIRTSLIEVVVIGGTGQFVVKECRRVRGSWEVGFRYTGPYITIADAFITQAAAYSFMTRLIRELTKHDMVTLKHTAESGSVFREYEIIPDI